MRAAIRFLLGKNRSGQLAVPTTAPPCPCNLPGPVSALVHNAMIRRQTVLKGWERSTAVSLSRSASSPGLRTIAMCNDFVFVRRHESRCFVSIRATGIAVRFSAGQPKVIEV